MLRIPAFRKKPMRFPVPRKPSFKGCIKVPLRFGVGFGVYRVQGLGFGAIWGRRVHVSTHVCTLALTYLDGKCAYCIATWTLGATAKAQKSGIWKSRSHHYKQCHLAKVYKGKTCWEIYPLGVSYGLDEALLGFIQGYPRPQTPKPQLLNPKP